MSIYKYFTSWTHWGEWNWKLRWPPRYFLLSPAGWDDGLKYQGEIGLLLHSKELRGSLGSHTTLTCNKGPWEMRATLHRQVHQGLKTLRMQIWFILTCPKAPHWLKCWERLRKCGMGTGRGKHSKLVEHQPWPHEQFKHSFIDSTNIYWAPPLWQTQSGHTGQSCK